MEIVNLEMNDSTLLHRVSVEKKTALLKEGINNFKTLLEVGELMREFLKSGEQTVDAGMDLLIRVESLLTIRNDVLFDANKQHIGSSGSIRRRLECYKICFDEFCKEIAPNIEMFLPFTTEQLTEVTRMLEETIGQLASFVEYQFGFNEILSATSETDIDGIYDAVDMYMRETGASVEDLIQMSKELQSVVLACKPRMELFELYPGLLEPFSALVGADLYDCEEIDLQTVRDVVDGKMPVEDFLENLEAMREARGDI